MKGIKEISQLGNEISDEGSEVNRMQPVPLGKEINVHRTRETRVKRYDDEYMEKEMQMQMRNKGNEMHMMSDEPAKRVYWYETDKYYGKSNNNEQSNTEEMVKDRVALKPGMLSNRLFAEYGMNFRYKEK